MQRGNNIVVIASAVQGFYDRMSLCYRIIYDIDIIPNQPQSKFQAQSDTRIRVAESKVLYKFSKFIIIITVFISGNMYYSENCVMSESDCYYRNNFQRTAVTINCSG